MEITLVERIKNIAYVYPDKIAVAFKNEHLTYSELNDKIINIGNILSQKGIIRGDRVLISAVSKPEMVAAYLAIQFAGGVVVFVDKNATTETIAKLYKDCDAALLLIDKPLKNLSENINIDSLRRLYNTPVDENNIVLKDKNDNELAELIFTTGTTGTPKGVELTYRAVRNILLNTIEGLGITKDDILLLALPLNHSLALRNLRAYLWLGASIVLQNGFSFIRDIEKNINLYHCSGMTLVPAIVARIKIQLGDRFSEIIGKLRYIEVGAGALTVGQRLELPNLLPETSIINTWGCSECGGVIFLKINEVFKNENAVSALGKTLPHVKVKTVDENGNDFIATKEQPGRMALNGDMTMNGYWKQQSLTTDALVDGWLITNDLIYKSDGYIYMVGRSDDIINIGGEKVSPLEIENAASQFHDMVECACVGVKDPEDIFGQIPVLYYVPKSKKFLLQELENFLITKLERFKIPKHYIQINKIPRNRTEKIDRAELKKMWCEKGKK